MVGEHDIDDLSSGEKELVYGYLRLRNVSPLNSIIMIDEPELHLNPRLVLGLPNFYRKHLGLELNNQLWMTTHSDAFLRDAYKGGGFTIYHMSPPAAVGAEDNQTVPISADDEINHAMFALVGDIAGFRPGNKVVIFESSENASFDASMTKRLFPEFADRINALSGDNKSGVKQLYAALNKAVAQMALPFNIYAIFDKDSAQEERSRQTRAFSWNVYHIENYLLEEQFISKVIKDNPSHATAMTEEQISAALRRCAKESLRPLIAHRMRKSVHATFSQCLDLGFDPNIDDPAVGLTQAVARVAERIQNKSVQDLNSDKLSKMRADIATALEKSLVDESWRTEFRGRDILKLFVGRYLVGLPYDAFRDAIVARMGDAGWRPPGMAAVIERILFDGDPFQAAKGH